MHSRIMLRIAMITYSIGLIIGSYEWIRFKSINLAMIQISIAGVLLAIVHVQLRINDLEREISILKDSRRERVTFAMSINT